MSSASQEELPRYPNTFIDWYYASRFIAIHLACLAAFWTGVPMEAVLLCVGLYIIRMFGVTAGYHRYFSHRTYKMNRVMQFLMALLAQSTMQRSVLWWAAHHRHHHKYSDQPEDVHSVKHGGFFWSHVGWVFSPRHDRTDYKRVKDLSKYPELRLLDRHQHLPAILLAIGCYFWMGWAGLVVGFFWSTVLLWHGTFTINSLSHMIGSRRYDTTDDSRNNFVLALITLGEGWHNNHHHYQASTNQGFFWWEVDLTYYGLWMMSKVGLVSDMRKPPRHVIENQPHPAAALKKAAQQARKDFEKRLGELSLAAQQAREEASQRVEDLGQDLAQRIDELSFDMEARMESLRESVLSARREAHEKLEAMALDASDKLDSLSQEMALTLAQMRTAAQKRGEEAALAIDEIAEVTKLRLQGGASNSQA